MRLLLFLYIPFLFLSCEDKQSQNKKKTETEVEKVDVDKKEVSKKPVKKKEPFKKLDDKSAMYFFQEYDKKHKENKVRITTDFGTIDILLFNETKYHRSNFIFLTEQNYFDGTQFYRVIDNFIAQAGNSDDMKTARKRTEIGRYLLPTDTKNGFKHDRGVVSMPSSEIDNPYKLASPYEFFIVTQQGGAHFLDGDYTIFGKVIDGMDVVDKITAVKTDDADWPLKNIYIRKAEVIE